MGTYLLFQVQLFLTVSLVRTCNIPKVAMPPSGFLLPDEPVIFLRDKPIHPTWHELSSSTTRESFYKTHGKTKVTLAASNRYSSKKVSWTIASYINHFEGNVNSSGNDAGDQYYLFGDNQGGIWSTLEQQYYTIMPPCHGCSEAGLATFGMGGLSSGVTFHLHGPGFSESIHGAKHWFLFPPNTDIPNFGENLPMAEWARRLVYGNCSYAGEDNVSETDNICADATYDEDRIQLDPQLEALGLRHCVIRPGEVLYFPGKPLFSSLPSYFLLFRFPLMNDQPKRNQMQSDTLIVTLLTILLIICGTLPSAV